MIFICDAGADERAADVVWSEENLLRVISMFDLLYNLCLTSVACWSTIEKELILVVFILFIHPPIMRMVLVSLKAIVEYFSEKSLLFSREMFLLSTFDKTKEKHEKTAFLLSVFFTKKTCQPFSKEKKKD